MSSVRDLERCAEGHLRNYWAADGPRAWRTYDRLGDPGTLEPVDLLAPALLDARIPGATVVAMFSTSDTAEAALLRAMQGVLDHAESLGAAFEYVELASSDGVWGQFRAALRASEKVRGVKATKVTKVLHRKRPTLIPIFDSRVAEFYGTSPSKPWDFWPVLQKDLAQNDCFVESLASGHQTVDGRPMSRLRAVDIAIWEHQTQGCAS